ncbi:MAG: hypothetical protein ACR2HV_01880 [Acidimicrobiales bacterium]
MRSPEPDAPVSSPEPDAPVSSPEPVTGRWLRVGVLWLTVAAITVVAAVPLLGNELRVQDWDAQFARDIVERVHHFGGTFYENGIYNKGPLELFAYNVARHLGGYDGMWYWVSIFGTVAGLVVAVVAGRTVRWKGAPGALALATGAVLFVHLLLSSSDYAGVLYARNMTAALLAIGWAVTFEERLWLSPRRRMVSCVVGGAVLGLVVQTLVAEVFAAAAIGLALVAMIIHRAEPAARARLVLLAVGSALATFLSAPAWYLLRGSFQEYWTSWYGHGRLMASGTGRSLGSQFGLGWDKMYSYYQQRPLVALAILAFLAFTYATWPRAGWSDRAMNLAVVGWLAGSWMEQILSQRYSSHYFVINAVPTALMVAVLVGYAGNALRQYPRAAKITIAMPLIAIMGALYFSGFKEFREGAKRASRFTSFSATAREEDKGKGGDIQAARGVLDLVSRDNDPILSWTNAPWPYLNFHRVAAGRFIWKSFLMGEIYLGGSGPQYVLPHTWEWFDEDIRRSQPAAFVKIEEDPAPGTPFADLVESQFQLVYGGKESIYLRTDVAREVLTSSATRPWVSPPDDAPGPGWTVGSGSAAYQGSADAGTNALPLAGENCVRIDGTADTAENAPPAFDVRFEDNATKPDGEPEEETMLLKLEGDEATSGSEAVEYESIPSGVQAGFDGPVKFSVVVGSRAAALVVDGQMRAAVRIPPSVTVSLTPSRSSLALTDLRVGTAPSVSGC